MTRVRTLASTNKEISNLSILKFDTAANIMILCASIDVFTKLHNLNLIDFKNYIFQLRKSLLYQLEWITIKKIKKELEIINYDLFLPKKLQDYVIVLQSIDSKALNHIKRILVDIILSLFLIDVTSVLASFHQFDSIKLTDRKLKNQYEILKAGLRAIAGKLAFILLKSDEFTIFTNIMIICACLEVYTINLQKDEDIHYYMNFEAYTAQLYLSLLYKSMKITFKESTNQV
ncbi:hypothetical protein CISG_03682 [Coccidioides immitis RMSCC 3703]|uniref:Uncharacterized protein n=1 Tax=Coccidioides immitis RMSCC 3703 TaxID=454286 RepID=A0A0J8TIS6_COCIT|nr:hypothetical protein CISG_03682 [Coccidioides immitis RMSCC 3703]